MCNYIWRCIAIEFSEKVKAVRKSANFSQEDLAHELGVSFATVNRWESGKSKPSKLAIRAFEEFCKAKSIVPDSDGAKEYVGNA